MWTLTSGMASIDKTEADAATAGKQPKPSFLRSKKFLIGIAILIAVIVIALAVGLGVGLSGNRGDNEPDDKGPQTGPGINRTTIWKPEVGATWQIILRKPINLSADNGAITPDSKVYDLDLFDNTADTFLKLHKAGVNVICYFSAGSWEDWREDAGKFDKVDLGKDLDGWPGEKWLNVSSSSVRDIMKARIKLAASKGCMAIDPDNVDGYKNNNGLGLTSAQAADFVKFLASEAASYNMSTGLKNAADIIDDVLSVVQFSVNEQCIELAECESFARFTKAKKPVFNIEYPKGAPDGLTVQTVDEICSLKGNATGSDGFSKVIKKMNLDGWVQYCDGKRYTTSIIS